MDVVKPDEERVPLERARNQLVFVWLIGGGVLFAVLVVQSILGRYGTKVQDAWSWFIPTIVPTISLMIGVLGSAALGNDDQRSVRRTFFGITWWLSVAYLAVLALTVVLQPFSPLEAIQLYQLSNYWLTPIQGVVSAAIGFLFTSQRLESKAGERG
jgi:general stress protein CsbA